ncbi:transporter suffix domain-containing protein [Rhizobium sp. P32RR-XVIII]|uniref:transporter suffix domain-containing protein n=1 Tax=Rhizobium sp. P32RR-XVIII TaxID=2726738 RepID=UPI0014566EE8|nr:transporter suffix domain-containing protein [Rhizobium sp. P32RR-XVIII]NLS06338.1 transporter suffix domain-containing protein [Rhizobium sp. P32RR-XVIII]
MTVRDLDTNDSNRSTWRFKLGIFLACLVIGAWLLVPILAWTGASAAAIATVTGMIFIWNKVLILVTIAVMGKPGFQELKRTIFGVFRFPPESSIGPVRYNIGLVMFTVPLLIAILEPYAILIWPSISRNTWDEVLTDVIFLASFLVLGGNFWEKFHALFVREARVVSTTDDRPTAAP